MLDTSPLPPFTVSFRLAGDSRTSGLLGMDKASTYAFPILVQERAVPQLNFSRTTRIRRTDLGTCNKLSGHVPYLVVRTGFRSYDQRIFIDSPSFIDNFTQRRRQLENFFWRAEDYDRHSFDTKYIRILSLPKLLSIMSTGDYKGKTKQHF